MHWPLTPNAVTDVTGFGLFGTRTRLPRGAVCASCSSRSASPRSTARSTPRARACGPARRSPQPRLRRRTWRWRTFQTLDVLGYDPQTAGGLLVSSRPSVGVLEAEFDRRGLFLRRIGVEEGTGVSSEPPWE